jgi:hypothetical protein
VEDLVGLAVLVLRQGRTHAAEDDTPAF